MCFDEQIWPVYMNWWVTFISSESNKLLKMKLYTNKNLNAGLHAHLLQRSQRKRFITETPQTSSLITYVKIEFMMEITFMNRFNKCYITVSHHFFSQNRHPLYYCICLSKLQIYFGYWFS